MYMHTTVSAGGLFSNVHVLLPCMHVCMCVFLMTGRHSICRMTVQ